jgi:hypothetical protein
MQDVQLSAPIRSWKVPFFACEAIFFFLVAIFRKYFHRRGGEKLWPLWVGVACVSLGVYALALAVLGQFGILR